VVYDEFPKTLLLLVIEDEKLDEAISVILENAKTGTMGDGKVFVTEVEAAYTVSKGTKGL
jgi:nitrogen regulatory protein PII 1